jgi:hypothetical protein
MRQVERTCKTNHMKIELKATPDVLVRNEGTVFLFCPLTPRAKEWIDERVQSDALWFPIHRSNCSACLRHGLSVGESVGKL